MLDPHSAQLSFDYYCEPAQRKIPSCSPYWEQDLSGLPPTTIMVGEYDGGRSQSEGYAKKLKQAGNSVEMIVLTGQTHGTILYRKVCSDSEDPAVVAGKKIHALLNDKQYAKTHNSRGYMHPLSAISKQFVQFSASAELPVMDMGCAYGNTVMAALKKGAARVIACDMAETHLAQLQEQVLGTQFASHLLIKSGLFPDGFDFYQASLSAIHTSHLLPYLTGDEADRGLTNFFRWLAPGGKLFIVCYSIYIRELVNEKFQHEYARRLKQAVKWPGYLENFDEYAYLPEEALEVSSESAAFPTALHIYDLPVLKAALIERGFEIIFADYLDGKANGAMPETWHDGREYLGIIARKPTA